MQRQEATRLITDAFQNSFNEDTFRRFIKNLLNEIDESKAFSYHGQFIPDAYKEHIKQYKRIGKYIDPDGSALDVLIVNLKKEAALDRARTMQRNFTAWYLKTRGEKDAALVSYFAEGLEDWRFSLIRMDYRQEETEDGRIKVKQELTPARRYSFLVGRNEPNHTAQQQLISLLEDDKNNPTLAQLENAFNIESVTKEFFERYKNLFLKVKEELDGLVSKAKRVKDDFTAKKIDTGDFAKKLLGQIVFLYFLQKKGWLGVGRDVQGKFKGWGTGPKDFLRRLYDKKIVPYKNFFNDLLEPLFYEALAIDRGEESYYSPFNCKIPFLNGGLFEPIGGYNWQENDILLKNETFDEIFNTFDLYNFTVREDEPLEKEVAVDPEMLGKVFENLLEVKDRKSKGTYYTPREIVHYMCQESLINYLDAAVNTQTEAVVPQKPQQKNIFGNDDPEQLSITTEKYQPVISRQSIEEFIRLGQFAIQHDKQVEAKGRETRDYSYHLPEDIRKNASLLDNKLSGIKICDPAIGSGAFPVGMLHEIVRARETMTNYIGESSQRTPYDFKRHAIQESIYGVDMEASAVDIAKLRLWLSLVVDEEDFETIKPLPNLDYKIVCGDSLLGVRRDLLNAHLYKELETLKVQVFDETNPRKKKDEKKRIDQLIKQITNNDQHFDYEVYFSEVFHHNSGFDIVIANPPYGIELPKTLKSKYKTFTSRGESYVIFIEKSFELLRSGGQLCFIVPDTYLNLGFTAALREFILQNSKLKEIVLLPAKVFEYATVDTTLLFTEKVNFRSRFHETDVRIKLCDKRSNNIDLNNPIREFKASTKAWHEQGAFNVQSDPAEYKLISRVEKQCLKLSQIAEMFYGIKCYQVGKGNPPQTKKILVTKPFTSDKRKSKSFLPFYDGKHIGRYALFWNNDNWLDYGAWLAEPRKPEKFEGEKILIRKIVGKTLIATYVSNTSYCNTLLYVVKLNEGVPFGYKHLLGILNSSFVGWYFRKKFQIGSEDTFPQIMINDILKIPIPNASDSEQKAMSLLVDKVLAGKKGDSNADIAALDERIDDMVYKLYGLTPEEIKIIEGKKS